MKKVLCFLFVVLISSCAEKLLKKPDNLIDKDKMIEIFNDLAILTAAKGTDIGVLRNHGINPMPYIYEKYEIDSLQFVESDRYYASMPEQHEEIYLAVTKKLETEEKRLTEEKKVNDSLKREATKNKKPEINSPPKSGNKKKQ